MYAWVTKQLHLTGDFAPAAKRFFTAVAHQPRQMLAAKAVVLWALPAQRGVVVASERTIERKHTCMLHSQTQPAWSRWWAEPIGGHPVIR